MVDRPFAASLRILNSAACGVCGVFRVNFENRYGKRKSSPELCGMCGMCGMGVKLKSNHSK
jgi:hypothetical protein